MKIIKNILIFIGLFLPVCIASSGQAILDRIEQEKNENVDKVVVGEIVWIKTPSDSKHIAFWSGIHTEVFKNDGYEIEVAPGEIMLPLRVKYNYADLSEEDRKMIPDDWDTYSHPRLKCFFSLPLHLFLNEKGELKDEAEEVIIYCNNKQTLERIKVVLTIRTAECIVDSTGVPFVVKTEGYRSEMLSYLEKNPNLIKVSLGQ